MRGLYRGLTLVELLVVLTILVALTTVAIRSTEGTLQQSRYDATVRTLQALEDAVLGPPSLREPDGTVRVSGYVADLGGLPRASLALQAEALWTNPGLEGYFPKACLLGGVEIDPEARLAVGWRGPYLRTAPGSFSLQDGWGSALELLDTAGNPVAVAGDSIAGFVSLGADRAPGGAGPFSSDLQTSVDLAVEAGATVTVTVRDSAGNPPAVGAGEIVLVVLFGPDPTTGSLEPTAGIPYPLTPGKTFRDPPDSTWQFDLTATRGPRLLRAYRTASIDTGDPVADLKAMIQAAAATPTGTSPLLQLVLEQGGPSLAAPLVLP